MSATHSPFICGLTEDPVERDVLKRLLNSIKNKYKVKLTSWKLPQHSRDAIQKTADFLQRPDIVKSFFVIVMKKLRYQSPEDYSCWIEDLTNNYDDALLLRLRFKPTQTYNALGDYIAGLNQFKGEHFPAYLTAGQKSCLLATSYVILTSPGLREDKFLYNWEHHHVRLADSELVTYICNNPDRADQIKELITEQLLVRPAELEAALNNGVPALIDGSL